MHLQTDFFNPTVSKWRLLRIFIYCILHGDSFRSRRYDAWRRCEFLKMSPQKIQIGRLTGRIIEFIILFLVFANVIFIVILSTFSSSEQISINNSPYIDAFQSISLAIFSIEYLARIWTCVEDVRFLPYGPIMGRVRWMCTPLSIIDLLSLLSLALWIVSVSESSSLSSLRGSIAVRLIATVRVFSVLRMERQVAAFRKFSTVLHRARHELLVAVFIGLVAVVTSACMIYFVENTSGSSQFRSIPLSMFWAVNLLTTAGCVSVRILHVTPGTWCL